MRQFEGLAKVYSLMFSTPRMRAQPCSFSGGCQGDSQPWLGGLPLPTAGLAKGLSISCFRACRLPGRGGSSLGWVGGAGRIFRAEGAERPESGKSGAAERRAGGRPGVMPPPPRRRRRLPPESGRPETNAGALRCRTPSSNGSRAPPRSRQTGRGDGRLRISANATGAR